MQICLEYSLCVARILSKQMFATTAPLAHRLANSIQLVKFSVDVICMHNIRSVSFCKVDW